MAKTYKGRYRVKNLEKYWGNPTKVVYRSLWERQVFKWMDENPNIVKWESEETVIPYLCQTDRRAHRYFMDVKCKTKDGRVYLIEIKPDKQTRPPKEPKRKSVRYLNEVTAYVKNQSKWEAATEYCKDRNWEFQIWTEHTLKKLGIKILK